MNSVSDAKYFFENLHGILAECNALELYSHRTEGRCVRLARPADSSGHGKSKSMGKSKSRPARATVEPHGKRSRLMTPAAKAAMKRNLKINVVHLGCRNTFCNLKGQGEYGGHCCGKCANTFKNYLNGACSQDKCGRTAHGNFCSMHF